MANYKSAISFGLVHIPVVLNPIIDNNDASFNMLHKKCKERVKYIKYCPHCEKNVKQDELIKGYEYSSNNYIIFEDEEFDKLKSEKDKTIDIIAFVDLNEIDPIYYERSYYLKTKENTRAFSLFKSALNKAGKVAVAKTFLGSKSYYVVLRFGKDNIIMTTLFYEEEIRLDKEPDEENFTKEELDLAIKLINSMTDNFKPEAYKDEYQNRLKEAIENKIDGKEIKQASGKKQKTINDLMKALETSIRENKKK